MLTYSDTDPEVFHVPRRMNDDSKVTDVARWDVKSMENVPAELVRKMLEYLPGEELSFALTCKSNLTHAKSLRKDGMLPMQRRSAYLCSGELTRYMLAHDMIRVDRNLMHIAAAHGCLEGMVVLIATEPPCPWHEETCSAAAANANWDVLQWARSQDPPCPQSHRTW